MRAPALAALLALLACALPAPALAASEQPPAVPAIEWEVMCPICGTLLALSDSPQAQREKAFVARLAREGETRQQIKDALVAQYGDEVLALPKASGFDLSAYHVPIVAFVAAAIALGLGVRRWRRGSGGPRDGGARPGGERPSEADAERLEADLARYDL
jgi:cytochrome c-type biogenesis protein CcmH/NrfF